LELALPTSQHIDTILHALDVMEKDDNLPDICVIRDKWKMTKQ
jgi:hypothetical protein